MKSSNHTTKIWLVFSAIIAVAMGARENHFNRPARSSEHIRYHRHIPFILQRHQLTDSQGISSPGYNPHYQREQQHHLTNRLLVEKKRRCQRVLDRTTNYSKVSTISRAKPSPRAGRQRYQLMLRRHGHRRYTIIPVSRNSYSGGRNQRRRNYIKTTISLPSRNYHGHYKSYSGLSRVSATEIRLTKPLTSIIPVSKTSTVTVPLGNPPSHQKRRNNVAITPTPRTAQLDRYSASPNGRRRIRVYLKGARGRHPYIFNNIASQSWSPCFRCPSDHLITVDRGRRCALASLPPLRSCSRLTSSPTSANIVVTVGPKPGTEVAEGEYFIQLHVEKFGVKLQTCQFRLKVKVQKCPPLKAPNNGYMMCTGGSRWGSVCKFACQRSYQLIGNYGVICEGDQHGVQWTGQLPMCRAQRCPSLRAPDHGYIMCSRGLLPPRSSCRFSCERNYQLVGCPVLFCDHRNIQWNRPPPECRGVVDTSSSDFFVLNPTEQFNFIEFQITQCH
ncbi:uncharacterized protein LOC111089466, partial [Limulus polyphemus]|uniref:Uncharacterized protein LOC111089466 n=1 Tax=Limulus polyphemus TaxID=6850 RepID=A0ABM1TPC4_LIMPO